MPPAERHFKKTGVPPGDGKCYEAEQYNTCDACDASDADGKDTGRLLDGDFACRLGVQLEICIGIVFDDAAFQELRKGYCKSGNKSAGRAGGN